MRRITLLTLSLLCFAPPAFAQFACTANVPQNVIQADLGVQVELATGKYKAREAAYQASLERRIKELTDTGAWTAAHVAAFYIEIPKNLQLQAQEKQVQHEAQQFTAALALASAKDPTDPKLVCERATEAMSLLSTLVASSDKQWELVEAAFQRVAKALRERKG